MTRTAGHRIALTVAVSVAVLALPGRVGAQTSTTSTTSTSTTSTSTTSTSTTSTSTTSTTVPSTTSTTLTTVPCPPQRCSATPPTAVLTGSRGEVAGEQGSFCWSDGTGLSAVCRDSLFLDPAASLTVSPGELLSLRFATSESPRELVLYRHDVRGVPLFAGQAFALAATNPSAVRADFPVGTSWLVVDSRWAQGSSVTVFKVNVKAPAPTNPPVRLALTG